MLLKTCCYPAERQRKKNEDGKIVSAKITLEIYIKDRTKLYFNS
jgi:hypothetical protein